jgi:hypothetical protein
MDHQPFEGWLLEPQPLTSEQKHGLNAHLQVCTSCRALAEVNLALKSVKVAAPAAGFTGRFKVRLAARRQVTRRRVAAGISLLAMGVTGAFLWFAWPVLMDLARSPVNLLASWVSSLSSFWGILQAILRAGAVLFKVAPGFVPAYIWAVILFAAGGWSLVWVVSLIKFVNRTQGA